ncbi:MAG: PD-(D/E)XK nuclease family protein, partial [Prevotella sp.]
TVLQKRFNDIWKNLGPLYHAFRDSLRKDGLAYEGMLYRDVVERKVSDFHFKHYIFVGFNLLQKVEQRFFRQMRDMGLAEFYWDYDTYFMTPQHEAGRYIRRYLDKLPNELGPGRASAGIDTDEVYNNLGKPKDITYISAPTEDIQARYVATWLRSLGDIVKTNPRSVAIMLCDENLLQNVIHCLPETVQNVNITTGYPLSATPAATLVGVLLALRLQGLNKDGKTYRLSYVNQVLRHPYAKFISEDAPKLYEKLNEHKTYFPTVQQLTEEQGAELIRLFDTKDMKDVASKDLNVTLLEWVADILKFVGIGSREEEDPLMHESVFRMYTVINRLKDLFATIDVETTPVLLQRLLSQLINATSVPFHGEPAIGIQIMGVLETRNLDFEHVLLLSCNEGNIPKGINDASFIPHSLRKGYEMTTIENKVAIYSYYFHSLLQRVSDATLTFNNATDDGRQGEMSRFMLQFMVESGQTIKRLTMQSGQSVSTVNRVPIEKDEAVQKKLADLTSLSPTAINRYLRCPLMFYYNTLCGLREDDDDDDQEIDNQIFGDIFHRTAELIYQDLSGKDHTKTITADAIDQLVKKEKYKIEAYLDQAFREKLFKVDRPDFRLRYNGLQLLNRNVLRLYVQRLLRLDREHTPFDILALESSYYDNLSFDVNGSKRTIRIGGQIDRLDKKGGQLRVIDYKTGKPLSSSAPTVDEIFNTENVDSKHTDYYLQAFLYSHIIRKNKEAIAAVNPGSEPVAPALLFIREAGKESYDPILKVKEEGQEDKRRASYSPVNDIARVDEPFISHLQELLAKIFDVSLPFTPTEQKDRCTNCPYKDICG